jgi:hypothetical protein
MERCRTELAKLKEIVGSQGEKIERMRQLNQVCGWHEKCHIVLDSRDDGDPDGATEWWAVRSPDQQHYLDENDRQWKPCPQVMGGWFMSEHSARLALHAAPLFVPAQEPPDAR